MDTRIKDVKMEGLNETTTLKSKINLELVNESKDLLIDLDTIKATLELKTNKFDSMLHHCLEKAMITVETYTGRSISYKTWKYTTSQNTFHLPKPKIDDILCVTSNKKSIKDYEIGHNRDTLIVKISSNSWDNENTVTYTAGYKTIDQMPLVLQNTIIECTRYFFKQEINLCKQKEENPVKNLREMNVNKIYALNSKQTNLKT